MSSLSRIVSPFVAGRVFSPSAAGATHARFVMFQQQRGASLGRMVEAQRPIKATSASTSIVGGPAVLARFCGAACYSVMGRRRDTGNLTDYNGQQRHLAGESDAPVSLKQLTRYPSR
jgi:hypothetical protein